MTQSPAERHVTPRWVKVAWILGAILLAGVIALHLTGNDLGSMHRVPAPTR